MSNIEYYNKLAKVYDIIYSNRYIGTQTEAEIKFLSKYISKDSVVLDIGCGTGRHILRLAPMVKKIVGIDNSEEMLNLARQKSKDFHQCEFKLIGIENYVEKEVFSLAIMLFTVVNHIVEHDSLRRSFVNIFNSLKKGGVLIFDLTNFYSFLTDYKHQMFKLYQGDNSGESCIRFNSHKIDEYNQLFLNNEFTMLIENNVSTYFSDIVQLSMYSVGEVKNMLLQAGFLTVDIFSGWTSEQTGNTKRHVFVVKK